MSTLFDDLLACVAVEEAITDEEEATLALLASLRGESYTPSPLQQAKALAADMQRKMALHHPPIPHSKFAPAGAAWKQHSAPLPLEYKADVNQRKGEITAYLTVWNDPNTGGPFIDPYKDIVHSSAFDTTVKELEQARRYKNTDYLVPDLWQHDRHEQIGGIKAFTKDSKGLIYVAQLVKSITRARYALDLAEQRMIGSSFGYDPVLFDYTGDIRNLKAVRLHEVSQVTFPANPYADVLSVKQSFYVPSSYRMKPNPFAALGESLLRIETWAASTKETI